jgi:outer membrane protein OmpA-like peptidoglycan-associated protein
MTIRIVPIVGLLGSIMLGLGVSQVAAQNPPSSESDFATHLRPQPPVLQQGEQGLPRPPHPVVPPNPSTPQTSYHPERILGPPSPPPQVTLAVQFAFNSAQLTPGSIETLRNLGNALNRELADQKEFLIEGHTDASGGLQYNIALSRRRADAVKDYLVHEVHVAPSRLQTVGKGPKELANPANPYAPENRRVLVINLGT